MAPLTRVYRLLLAVLPTDFRHAYGDEMEDLFRRRLERARRERGTRAVLAVTMRELVDVVVTGLRLRAKAFVTRRAPAHGTHSGGRAERESGRARDVLAGFWQDLRAAVRGLRKRPRFALTAVATLAVGIGSATAIFSVLDAVLLRPLPYPDSERLVMVWRVVERYDMYRTVISYPDYVDWRDGLRTFEELAASASTVGTVLEGGEPERLVGGRVSGNLFRALGVSAALGRTVEPADDRPGAQPVIVLGHGLWQRRFGGDPAVLGRTIELGDERLRVVGVMPASFDFPSSRYAYWVPLRLDPATAERDVNFLQVVGRITTGVPLEAAEADLRSVAERVTAAHPGANETDDVWLESRHAFLVRDVRTVLLLLAGAVALLLLLACTNLTNLLLVRASGRRRELAIRAALGAGKGRLGWPLLSESLVLALLGGAIGVGLAVLLTDALLALEPGELPRRAEIELDARVLGFAIALSLACGILCGLLPALSARRSAPADRLREGGGSVGARSSNRLQAGLAVAQVALAMVMLVGAGLLGHSLYRLLSVPTGFEGERVLTTHVTLPSGRYGEDSQVNAFYDELLARLEGLPGVEAVGATWALPFSSAWALSDYVPVGAGEEEVSARSVVLAPVRGDYFRALGMTLLRGRAFTPADGADAPPVAVINQTLARAFWPGVDPIGKRFRGAGPSGHSEITVVGVVADVKRSGLDATTEPEAYRPHQQALWGNDLYVTLRTVGDPHALAPAVRREVLALDSGLPLSQMRTLAERVDESVATPRFRAVLFGALAATAGLLALVGIYGVVSFVVAQRTREIAVRVALGARRGDVVAQVLARGGRLALGGVVLGTAGALVATRSLESFLFEVRPLDPITFGSVGALLLAAALLACYAPARRAAAADPVVTLREE